MPSERPIHQVVHGEEFHWVGDGFRVTNLFPSTADLGARISPFLLLDYHAPYQYGPTDRPRGVGVHPHRGSRPSPSPSKAASPTTTAPAPVGSSIRETCSG